jgi:nucleotide-binding universal stress UspA family protein
MWPPCWCRGDPLYQHEVTTMDINTIVVGYDGSDGSERAIDAALTVLNDGGTVHLVSAYDAPSARQVKDAYASVPAELTSAIDLMSGPRSKLEEAARLVADKGHTVVQHFIDDDPASAILDIADQVEATMLVVGSRGLGRASRVLRGSVSTKIAHHAHIDFMVIH